MQIKYKTWWWTCKYLLKKNVPWNGHFILIGINLLAKGICNIDLIVLKAALPKGRTQFVLIIKVYVGQGWVGDGVT